jgi:hypothetical protein
VKNNIDIAAAGAVVVRRAPGILLIVSHERNGHSTDKRHLGVSK